MSSSSAGDEPLSKSFWTTVQRNFKILFVEKALTEGIRMVTDPKDNEKWYHGFEAEIDGPTGTLYEGGTWTFRISLPPRFPYVPPIVYCLTPIQHVNFGTNGVICLDLLKGAWTPAITIDKLLLSIQSLLADPNPTDPLNGHLAGLMTNAETRSEYEQVVRRNVEEHAKKRR